jgi:hypothetical protein
MSASKMRAAHSKSDRGAVLIQVAVVLLGLTLFSAFVVDYGVLWVSRAQAQNSADAAALAAGLHMELDPSDHTGAVNAAYKLANANAVWLESPAAADVLVDLPITCPPGTGGGLGCVRVDVMRGAKDRNNVQHTNYLPTIFAQLAGLDRQGVIATATAMVSSGNAVQCIKPWIVADKWQDSSPDTDPAGATPSYYGDSWDRDDTFDGSAGDTYNATQGFNPSFDSGYQMPLKPGSIGTWSAGWAMEIDFGMTGSANYKYNIEGCPSWVPTVGIFNPSGYAAKYAPNACNASGDPTDPALGCLSVKTGMSQGPTSQGVDNLVNLDSGAHWVAPGDAGYVDNPDTHDDDKGYVVSPCETAGNCMSFENTPLSISPRIVPIAIMETADFIGETCSGTGCVARVVNLAGFFIEGMCDEVYPNPGSRPTWCGSNSDAKKIVLGRFMKYPGQFSGSSGTSVNTFAQEVILVR